MTRVEILYDFDFGAFEYYKQGLNHHPCLQFSRNKEIFYPLESIKEWNAISCLYLLSCGLDKICISESSTNKCFILEPCSAMFFICELEENFAFFLKEKRKGLETILNCGILLYGSVFRFGDKRNIEELSVNIQFQKIETEWFISFKTIDKKEILKVPLSAFLSSYFEFGERMIRFYDHVLPEYKEFKYQYPLFIKAVQNSVILEEFEVKPQSSYDGQTYYDFQ